MRYTNTEKICLTLLLAKRSLTVKEINGVAREYGITLKLSAIKNVVYSDKMNFYSTFVNTNSREIVGYGLTKKGFLIADNVYSDLKQRRK